MSNIQDTLVEGYPVRIRVILGSVVMALAVVTYAFPRFAKAPSSVQQSFDEVVEAFEIPPTQQFEIPPPPARPSIPVQSESEDIAEDITIEETDLESFVDWDAPPPPPEEGPIVRFIAYDEPPEPVGGYAALQRNLVYPEFAAIAGIQGTVVVQAFVNNKGRVTDTVIIEGIPETGMDEAAVIAIKKTRFKPAKQRDKPLGVWIAIPIKFGLKG